MAFQSCPNIVEAVFHASTVGKDIANVVHFIKTGGYNQADVSDLATELDNWVNDEYVPQVAIGVTYNQTTVRGLADINDVSAASSGGSAVGALGPLTLPSNVSLCITFRTGLTGRSGRGRFYCWPTVTTNLISDNTFDGAYVGAMTDALSGMMQTALNLGFQLCILSRFQNKAARALGVGFVVNDIVARNPTVDSQRGRLPKNH